MSGNVTTTAFELPARAAAWPADLRAMAGLLRVALGTAGPETILPWPAQLDPDAFLAAVMRQRVGALDRKSTRLNSSHSQQSRMPSSA